VAAARNPRNPRIPAVRGRRPVAPVTPPEAAMQAALRTAIGLARYAPSLHNAQPWTWRLDGDTAELSTDPRRSVPASDPSGRDTMLGCGAALHHARTALAAAGWRTLVTVLPETGRPGLLARIELIGRQSPPQPAMAMAGAICRRRADRRLFHGDVLPAQTVAALRSAVEQEGCRLTVVAAEDDGTDPAAPWAILHTDGDSRADGLRAGQAMSALMLTATDLGVAVNVRSLLLVEVAAGRAHTDDRLFDHAGHEQLVVGLGRRVPVSVAPAATPAPRSPTGDVPHRP
jgi:nitroreductase